MDFTFFNFRSMKKFPSHKFQCLIFLTTQVNYLPYLKKPKFRIYNLKLTWQTEQQLAKFNMPINTAIRRQLL